MKILMFGGRYSTMMDEVRQNLNVNSLESRRSNGLDQFTMKDGSTIHVAIINHMHDVDKLRGLKFDLIIEHPSFCKNIDILYFLRGMVLK